MADITPAEIFEISSPLTPDQVAGSHHLFNADHHHYPNYRTISNYEVVKHKVFPMMSRSLLDFINDSEVVIVVANEVAGKVASLVLRSLTSHQFMVYGPVKNFPYGIGMFGEISFGIPMVCVEGFLDRDALLPIYPYVISALTSSLSIMKMEILSSFTNKVILMYDNDTAGKDGIRKDTSSLQKMGLQVRTIDQPLGVKDSGVLAETLFSRDIVKYEELSSYYHAQITQTIQTFY